MKKVVSPCFCKVYTRSRNEAAARAFCEIQFEDGRLSITGVIGPLPSGNCRGGAGQCVDAIRKGRPCDEWTQEMLDKFCSIWDEWHLNDMRPYCKHQKELGWDKPARVNGMCQKMFGVSAVEWLNYQQCSKLIEALKSMLKRQKEKEEQDEGLQANSDSQG